MAAHHHEERATRSSGSAEEPPNRPAEELSGGRATITFATLALGAGTYALLQSMVVPALPVIRSELGTSQATSAWVLTAYLLSASVATPILGRLGDMFGKKKMFVLVMAALALGSVLASLSTTIGMLIAARIVQGLAGAVFPLSFGIIRDEFPVRRVPGAIGLISGMLGIGSALGIVAAGPLITRLSWHWLFWIPAAISTLAMIATMVFIRESSERSPGRVNLPAAVALSGWLVALLIGLSRGAEWGWASPRSLGLFTAAAALFTLWVQIENRSSESLIDLQMMRIPSVWWTNVASLLLGAGMYAAFMVVPGFLQTPESTGYGFGASVTVSGLYLLPSTVAMITMGFLIGRLTARYGAKVPLVVGCGLAGAPFFALAFAHHEPWQLVLATLVHGVGIGLAFSSMPNLIMEAVSSTQTGAATGMNANIRTIGGSFGTQATASILASGTLVAGFPRARSYGVTFAVVGCALAAAALAAMVVPMSRGNRAGATQRLASGASVTDPPMINPPVTDPAVTNPLRPGAPVDVRTGMMARMATTPQVPADGRR